MPRVLRVIAMMDGCEYGCGGMGRVLGVDVVIVGKWGLLVVLLMGVVGVLGGCWCCVGSLLVWSGS